MIASEARKRYPTTAISYEGDDIDRASLRELARRKKMTVGKLTKEAIDTVFGQELAEIRPFFVAQGSSWNVRPDSAGTGDR